MRKYYLDNIRWITVVLVVIYLFAQILNTPIIVVYRFGIYGFTFFLGYFVFAQDEVMERLACLAFLGCGKRFLDFTAPLTAYMSSHNFGLYVFHYLSLSATAFALTSYTALPATLIYLLTVIAAFAGAIILYEVISRIPVLHYFILGIKKK